MARVDAQPGHEQQRIANVDERAVPLPGRQARGLEMLLEAARRRVQRALELLAGGWLLEELLGAAELEEGRWVAAFAGLFPP